MFVFLMSHYLTSYPSVMSGFMQMYNSHMYFLSVKLQQMLLNVICWAFEKTQCAYVPCSGSKLSEVKNKVRSLHCDFRQLLFGEVQRMVDGCDAKLDRFGRRR